ncbi:hypothetical protein LCDV1gp095 [Lymphocystis disease virus 1]|uniref:hypothetical protein n=1 Tax=Fish lymphocystis disease virus TaxID=36363 RepID=UPI0000161F03|nr:hypothetical protein LCDV1gp095 [Lymphocystis disease virus 1]
MKLHQIVVSILLTIAILLIGYYCWKSTEKLTDKLHLLEMKLNSTPVEDVGKIFDTLEQPVVEEEPPY